MGLQRLPGTVSAAALLPLRLFLGVTFLYAGKIGVAIEENPGANDLPIADEIDGSIPSPPP